MGNFTIEQVRDEAAYQAQYDQPKYRSTKVETVTFSGVFTPTDSDKALVIFSDDGCRVTIDGVVVFDRFNKGQHLPNLNRSFHHLPAFLRQGAAVTIKVEYSNVLYTGEGDMDGCTLFLVNSPEIEFIRYNGESIQVTDLIPVIHPGKFHLIVHHDDPLVPFPPQDIDEDDTGSDGGGPITVPVEPIEAGFRIRITDSSQASDVFQINLCGESQVVQVTMERVGTSEVFISVPLIYAIEGKGIDDEVISYFSPYLIFIDPRRLTLTYKAARGERVTARGFLVHRFKPAGQQNWGMLSDQAQPAAIEHDTSAELYCVIRVENFSTRSTDYFLGDQGDNFPNQANVDGGVRALKKWPGAYGAPSFVWSRVKPKYQDFSNLKEAGQFKFDKLDYEEEAIGGNPAPQWGIALANSTIGVYWWTVEVSIAAAGGEGGKFGPPGKDARNARPGDMSISDEVKRIVRRGNYPNEYLKWASSFIQTPWVFGSHMTSQVDKYIGTDCTDLCIGAYRKMGKNYGVNPEFSAHKVVEVARAGNNPDFTLVFDNKTLADNVPRNQLKPGDLFVLRSAANPRFAHAVVYVGEKNAGNLDGTEKTIMANWDRPQHPGKEYRVEEIELRVVLTIGGGPYDTFSVVRLKFP